MPHLPELAVIVLALCWSIEHCGLEHKWIHPGYWWDVWHWCARIQIYGPMAWIFWFWIPVNMWLTTAIVGAGAWYGIRYWLKPPSKWGHPLPVRLFLFVYDALRGR